MAQPRNTGRTLAGLGAAEGSRNDTSHGRLGSSLASNTGSSLISNGSLLDLYAQSMSSSAGSTEAGPSYGVSPHQVSVMPPDPEQGAFASQRATSNGPPLPPKPSNQLTASNNNEGNLNPPRRPTILSRSSSEWTSLSAREPEPIVGSKRASIAGFDAEVFRNIRPAHANAPAAGKSYDSSTWRAPLNGKPSLASKSSYNDSDSDGSHYEDDEAGGASGSVTAKQVQRGSQLSRQQSQLSDPHRRDLTLPLQLKGVEAEPSVNVEDGRPTMSDFQQKNSGLASPPVPQRKSSSLYREQDPISPNPSNTPSDWPTTPLQEEADRIASRALSRRPSLALHTSQIPLRRSSSEIRRSSDLRRPLIHGRSSSERGELQDGLGISSSAVLDSPERRSVTSSYDSGSRALTNDVARNSGRGSSLGSVISTKEASPTRSSSHAREMSEFETGTLKPAARSQVLQVVNEDPTIDTQRRNQNASTLQSSRPTSRDSEPNSEEQARLERELLAGDADGSRPKTLQEARQRAKARRQQSEAAVNASQDPSPIKQPASASSRAVRREEAKLDEAHPRKSVDSVDRPSRDPRRLSAKDRPAMSRASTTSDVSAPSTYSHASEPEMDGQNQDVFNVAESRASFEDAYGGVAEDAEAYAPTASGSGGMEELTAAVSSAMEDLSFGSADDSSNTIQGIETGDRPEETLDANMRRNEYDLQTPKAEMAPRFEDGPTLSAAKMASADFPLASPYTDKPLPAAAKPSMASKSSAPSGASARSPATRPPAAITRIEIYGATVPLPQSFVSSAITDKRKSAPWERARMYAQFTNELLALQTGLDLWISAVQRPAMRQRMDRQSQEAVGPQDDLSFRATHVRNEGSYAASVRSDLTFPMRGDGGRAKEIIPTLPTMAESPPSRLPANLPYPALAESRSNSTSSSVSAVPSSVSQPLPNHEAGAAHTMGRSSGLTTSSSTSNTASRSGTSGNFFSSLGRKGSRRAPGGPVLGLSSITGAAGGPRGTRIKGKTISAPIQAGTAGTERRSMDVDPGSPDMSSSSGRLSGLGESASAGRLQAVNERHQVVRGLTTTSVGRSSPMGPRAPGPASGQGFFSSIGRSSSSDLTRTMAGANATATGVGLGSSSGGTLSSPILASPEVEQGWSDPAGRFKNMRSGSSASLLGSKDSALSTVRSSFSYGTVREKIRGIGPSSPNPANVDSGDPGFQEALNKLADVLPDADNATLAYYLKRAKGNDLVAIGDYLQDQSLGKLPK